MIHVPNVGAMLDQRRKRWPNIAATLAIRITFALATPRTFSILLTELRF